MLREKGGTDNLALCTGKVVERCEMDFIRAFRIAARMRVRQLNGCYHAKFSSGGVCDAGGGGPSPSSTPSCLRLSNARFIYLTFKPVVLGFSLVIHPV